MVDGVEGLQAGGGQFFEGGGQLELGLAATIVDQASEPAQRISAGLEGMFNWFERLVQQARSGTDDFVGMMRGDQQAARRTFRRIENMTAGLRRLGDTVQNTILAPFRAAGRVIRTFFNRFTAILTGIAATVAGFLAFRSLKRQIDEIFESTVKLEEQMVSIANLAGSDEFAADLVGWAEQLSQVLPLAEEQILGIGKAFTQVGIEAQEVDLPGLFAAAQIEGRDPAAFAKEFGQAIREGRILELFQGFSRIPLELAGAATQLDRFDFTGRARALSEAFGAFAGPEAVERIRNSVTGIRQLFENTFTVIRRSILGRPGEGGLFDTMRERMAFFLETLQRNRPLLEAVGEAIGNILNTAARAFNRLLGRVLDRFGLRVTNVAERVANLNTRVLEPLQVAATALITLLERAVTGQIGFIDVIKQKFEEIQPILRLVGAGIAALGVVTFNPFLVAAGLGLYILNEPTLRGAMADFLAPGEGRGIEDIKRDLVLIGELAGIALIGVGIVTGNPLLIGAGILIAGISISEAMRLGGGVTEEEARERISALQVQPGMAAPSELSVPSPELVRGSLEQRTRGQQVVVQNFNLQIDPTTDPQKVQDTAAAVLEEASKQPGVRLGTEPAVLDLGTLTTGGR